MIKRYWRGYVCDPMWRSPEIWMDAIVFSTPKWNYAIQLPKALIRIRSKKRGKRKEQTMNDDLIRRSDAIKAIDKRIKELSKHPEFVRKNGHIDVIGVKKYILAIPSADRPQEWIPCGERMPEYRKVVLISTFWGVKTGFLDSTEAYGDFWEIIEEDATTALHNIYAWMPLPAPWEGEDNEESM